MPAELLADLESEDSTVRDMASIAVAANSDPRLVPYVRRTLADINAYVRLRGFSMGLAGLRRHDAAYGDIKPALDALARDRDWTVQLNVLETLAFTGDPICIPVLLDVLEKWARGDPVVPDKDFGQLVILVESISHQKFGFDRSSVRQDPGNNRAIERFSAWVAERRRI